MSKPHLLITGGAGYIGSHVLRLLLERDYTCVVLDDLSNGHREAIPQEAPFFLGTIQDSVILEQIFNTYPIEGILHFAGFIEVGESVRNPGKYFQNNLTHSFSMLEEVKSKIKWLLFSSSAAVYGEPETIPITETALTNPTNPYGFTKLAFEKALKFYEEAYHVRSISLRYFNASGAHPSGEIGENHEPESHLIPLACKAALKKTSALSIYGDDYPTPDGTCIRDYVHIMDLAAAHCIAVEKLSLGHVTDVYNIGSENGYSVKEVVECISEVSGIPVPYVMGNRRAGDPPRLVASSKKFQKEFDWKPSFQSLRKIVESAWKWHSMPLRAWARSEFNRKER